MLPIVDLNDWLSMLILKFDGTHKTENLQGFSEVGEKKQLLIVFVSSF